ncbi:hypothetical protein [Halobellus rufus]|uniref:hypothetical protein n=1 Tax=Halobellus rufus TaxID=1448860 RepID=UPI000678FF89|nr:hypothetical protein [Halobellus rufus]
MDEEIRIANEFAVVTVRKVQTNAGERLEIAAPKKDSKIHLDAVALESLTWQDPELFSDLLEEPHGPE